MDVVGLDVVSLDVVGMDVVGLMVRVRVRRVFPGHFLMSKILVQILHT